ncbi:MAG: LysR family transcriptional regulator substrate-binding protein, partial [Candidatus Hydrogenedentes bacterium]|nr:LysR family transcriptional regulator substrate-binding protein [Candidatus Hydrogenedentota bacterium]
SMLLLDENTRTGKILRACLREAGFEPQVGLDSGSFEVIKRHVAAGVGVALLPDAVISEHDTGLATVNVPGLPEIVIGAIWRKRAGQTKAAQEFLDLLIEK